MQRRTFVLLGGAALATGALALTVPWAADTTSGLRRSLRRARRRGKPLLVIPVTVTARARGANLVTGEALAVLLGHGDDAALADLAACELVAASVSDVVSQIPEAKSALPCALLLVDVDGSVTAAVGVPRVVPYSRNTEPMRERMTVMAAQLDLAVAGDPALLVRRAAANARAMGVDESARDPLAGLDDAGILARGTWLRSRASADDRLRQVITTRLARAARTEWVDADPRGCTWMHAGGCAAAVPVHAQAPTQQRGGVACGMGSVQPMAEKFLAFYPAGAPR